VAVDATVSLGLHATGYGCPDPTPKREATPGREAPTLGCSRLDRPVSREQSASEVAAQRASLHDSARRQAGRAGVWQVPRVTMNPWKSG